MRKLLALFLLTSACGAQESRLAWPNTSLEDGLDGWRIEDRMCTRSEEQAADGRWSLKVVDTDEKDGSNAFPPPIPIEGEGMYRLDGRVFPVSGSGLGIYCRVLDADGRDLVAGDTFTMGAPSEPTGRWRPFSLTLYAPAASRTLQVWVHSYNAATVTAYLDAFAMSRLEQTDPAAPLWPAQYKIGPGETARLTPADVPGPDGIVYPNWTRTGVPGGIPELPARTRVDDFGGRPGDGADDSDAILQAVEAAAAAGGGAVLFSPGVYHLSRMIAIKQDGIVLRGAGREATRIVFDYGLGPEGIRWGEPAGEVLMNGTNLSLFAAPTGLRTMEIFVNDQSVAKYAPSTHSGNTFSLTARGYQILDRFRDATTLEVRGTATWADGRRREITRTMRVDRAGADPDDTRRPAGWAAIAFCGEGAEWKSKPIKLAADGQRGAMTLTLESTEGLAAGDHITIDGPATERWKALTRNQCQWGTYRRYQVRIAGIEGNTIALEQPLRIEFPVIDGSRIWKIDPVRRCGIEGLTIDQTENLWITTVAFSNAWECWARGVTVNKCGRFPIYGMGAKWCTIDDCLFDDAWFKGGGGTAYAGWEHSWDCLMDRCETRRLRHAPCVQWSAAGNVIRRSTFIDSDAQWHSGWTNENLFEQCTVIANPGNGAYGYGAWASPPEDTAHGPNGPRNTVYNCDLRSTRTGLWMGGMNENWLILHNRFVVAAGQGIFAKTFSFDHIIRGNVFALADAAAPAVLLQSPDCSGVELLDNTVYGGVGTLSAGLSRPARAEGNRLLPYQADPPRPAPAVESIYEWQQANVRR